MNCCEQCRTVSADSCALPGGGCCRARPNMAGQGGAASAPALTNWHLRRAGNALGRFGGREPPPKSCGVASTSARAV
eukprot:13982496-Alexandrium_andersonii.AAC.1